MTAAVEIYQNEKSYSFVNNMSGIPNCGPRCPYISLKNHRETHVRERTTCILRTIPTSKSFISDCLESKNYSCRLCSYQAKNKGYLTRQQHQCHPTDSIKAPPLKYFIKENISCPKDNTISSTNNNSKNIIPMKANTAAVQNNKKYRDSITQTNVLTTYLRTSGTQTKSYEPMKKKRHVNININIKATQEYTS